MSRSRSKLNNLAAEMHTLLREAQPKRHRHISKGKGPSVTPTLVTSLQQIPLASHAPSPYQSPDQNGGEKDSRQPNSSEVLGQPMLLLSTNQLRGSDRGHAQPTSSCDRTLPMASARTLEGQCAMQRHQLNWVHATSASNGEFP